MKEGWLRASLAEKIPEQAARRGLGPLRSLLAREADGLQVDWEFSTRQKWLEVAARGDDAEAFLNVLKQKSGIIPVEGSKVEKWDVVRGFITGSGRTGFGVYVDLGVLEPVAKDGLYPLHRMRAQLADGAVKPCREILEEYCLVDDFPVRGLVTSAEDGRISLELSEETLRMLWAWRSLPFDRVLAGGALMGEVEGAVRKSGLQYDVIRVEPLSMFFQCLVCKMDTDAPGIIARIGNRLRGVRLAAYRANRTGPSLGPVS